MNKNNNAAIYGTLIADAKTGTTEKGKGWASFMICWKKPTASDEEKPYSFPVTLYGREKTYEKLKKGKRVAVFGRIETGYYEKDGRKISTHKLVADDIDTSIPADGKFSGKATIKFDGYLAADPKDLSYIPNKDKTAVLDFNVLVNKYWDENNPDRFPVTVFGKRAESLSRYLHSGKRVVVEGSIETSSFTGKTGDTVYTYRVVPFFTDEGVMLLGGKKKKEAPDEAAEAPQQSAPEMEVAAENSGLEELPPDFEEVYYEDDFDEEF